MRNETRQPALLRVGGFLRAWVCVSTLLIVAFAWVPSSAHASTSSCPPGATAAACALGGLNTTSSTAGLGTVTTTPTPGAGQEQLATIIGTLINGALAISGVIFLVLIIYGGFRWMTAQGAPDEIEKAKEIIRSAIIGIVLLALAFAITNFVIHAVVVASV